ncbi:MAG: DsbA family protein [Gammaproteobacteria bacterium]|nr:DsbA family protein [Gammaproteobacteria bacterium]
MKLRPFFIAMVSGLTLSASVLAAGNNSLNVGGFDPTAGQQTQNAESKLSKAAALRNSGQLLHSANNPVAGNPYGTLSIVEFFDYQCHHCVEMDPKIRALISSNPNLRVIYKEFPIRGAVSEYAAKAALAANMQGKYIPFHEALMQASNDLSEEKVLELAKANGLDVQKLKTEMNSETVNRQIAENTQLAQNLGLSGTPAFFVSKTLHPSDATSEMVLGQVDQSYLQDILNKISH